MTSAHPSGEALLDALESGEVRVAERTTSGEWCVHAWVKEAILELFRTSALATHGTGEVREVFPFVDKAPFAVRQFDVAGGIRLVPGGSSVRRGVYLGRDVVLMPPCYANIGAHVGAGSMIDSHALIGSCAQIGADVHVSAGVQIGGVLEPVGARPVIIEDGCMIGGQAGVYEGVCVRAGAVLGAGCVLAASTPVFDLVNEVTLRGSLEHALEIPEGAVVVPATRPARGNWAHENGLGLACAAIVKYRDASTDRATALEDALRER